ncbi:MAG: GNAT family acetyltransferase [Desulfobacterales bacterium S5133MH4]|nr:MAG: GNAT family acetyltransferase [Desulfobacterales bacterium S5133MH4]
MIEIRILKPLDDRTRFRSGNADLDRFFVRYAGQNQFRHHIGATYVALEDCLIKGFVTVSASHIEIDQLPAFRKKRLPRYPLPVLRLARLAVDDSARGRGIGSLLLRAVFSLASEMGKKVGCVGVVVDAKPHAISFYERYGFIRLETLEGNLGDRPEPIPMFVSLGSIPDAARFQG